MDAWFSYAFLTKHDHMRVAWLGIPDVLSHAQVSNQRLGIQGWLVLVPKDLNYKN